MKKLFLTSFEFKTGENTYKEQRLVMVQSNEIPEGKDEEFVAYDKIKKWFPVNFPESSLLEIQAYPTITGYAEGTQIENRKRSVFEKKEVITAEEFIREKRREQSPEEKRALSQTSCTHEQALRWAHEYAILYYCK